MKKPCEPYKTTDRYPIVFLVWRKQQPCGITSGNTTTAMPGKIIDMIFSRAREIPGDGDALVAAVHKAGKAVGGSQRGKDLVLERNSGNHRVRLGPIPSNRAHDFPLFWQTCHYLGCSFYSQLLPWDHRGSHPQSRLGNRSDPFSLSIAAANHQLCRRSNWRG